MSNTDIVRRFIGCWDARDVDAIVDGFTPDAVYDNVPLPTCVGRPQIREFVTSFLSSTSSVRFELHNIAETEGGVVLTERTDHFVIGGRTVSLRVMGAFELRDGLIAAWRDYFDRAEWQSQASRNNPAP